MQNDKDGLPALELPMEQGPRGIEIQDHEQHEK